MYTILPNLMAEVDSVEFEKIGRFADNAIAVPRINVSVAMKGMQSSPLDQIEDCQNTFFVTYEPDYLNLDVELEEDPLKPGIIYRRDGKDYTELEYKHRLGSLSVVVYFLVRVEDCIFSYRNSSETYAGCSLNLLYTLGFIRSLSR
jgi:hypothetical protein